MTSLALCHSSEINNDKESTFLTMEDSDSEEPLLLKALSINDLEHPISNPFQLLPNPLFLHIMALSDIITASEVCHDFYQRIRLFIPAHFFLSDRPSPIEALKLIRAVEACEQNYISDGFDQHILPESYLKGIGRLSHAAALIKYSPYFWFNNGTQRVKNILNKHQEHLDLHHIHSKFPHRFVHYFSYLYRDPYILTLTSTFLATLTSTSGPFINHYISSYHNDTAAANRTYEQDFQNNLHYAQTSLVDEEIGFKRTKWGNFPSDCVFHCDMPETECFNATLAFEPELLVSLFNKTGILSHYSNAFNPNCRMGSNELITPHLLKDLLIENLHKMKELNNWDLYFKRRLANSSSLIYSHFDFKGYMFPGGKLCVSNHTESGEAITTDYVGFLAIGTYRVTPDCIATFFTPPQQELPFPQTVSGWIAADIMACLIFFGGLYFGWFLSI